MLNYIQNRFNIPIVNQSFDIANDNILFHTENEVQKPFYMVKVVSDNGNKYQFNDSGTSAETIQLVAGNIYLFDQSHSSNSGHPLLYQKLRMEPMVVEANIQQVLQYVVHLGRAAHLQKFIYQLMLLLYTIIVFTIAIWADKSIYLLRIHQIILSLIIML